MSEKNRIMRAKDVLTRIANGINPISGESLEDESFLNDPQIIRCLYYVSEILENILSGVFYKRTNGPFRISQEQKNAVTLPDGSIGINDFVKCINDVLDISDKKLTGVELNKKLKMMGILSEHQDQGKRNTVTNDYSLKYGFDKEHRSFNGREYDKIVINDEGKKYLMQNLEIILAVGSPA